MWRTVRSIASLHEYETNLFIIQIESTEWKTRLRSNAPTICKVVQKKSNIGISISAERVKTTILSSHYRDEASRGVTAIVDGVHLSFLWKALQYFQMFDTICIQRITRTIVISFGFIPIQNRKKIRWPRRNEKSNKSTYDITYKRVSRHMLSSFKGFIIIIIDEISALKTKLTYFCKCEYYH